MTLERVELPAPAGAYIMEWLEGDVAVCDTGSNAFFEGETLFTKVLVRDSREDSMHVALWQAHRRRWRFFDFAKLRSDYRNLQVTLFFGPTRAVQDISAVLLRMRRHSGAAIYWEAVRVYNILGLQSHKG